MSPDTIAIILIAVVALLFIVPYLVRLRLLWHRGSFYKGRKSGRL